MMSQKEEERESGQFSTRENIQKFNKEIDSRRMSNPKISDEASNSSQHVLSQKQRPKLQDYEWSATGSDRLDTEPESAGIDKRNL